MQDIQERIDAFNRSPHFSARAGLAAALASLEQKRGVPLPNRFSVHCMEPGDFEGRAELGKIADVFYLGFADGFGGWHWTAFENKQAAKLFFAEILKSEQAAAAAKTAAGEEADPAFTQEDFASWNLRIDAVAAAK